MVRTAPLCSATTGPINPAFVLAAIVLLAVMVWGVKTKAASIVVKDKLPLVSPVSAWPATDGSDVGSVRLYVAFAE